MKRTLTLLSVMLPLIGASTVTYADTWVVTANNDADNNRLLVFDLDGKQRQSLATGGQGGVSGNSGGIAANGNMVAVVNYGSNSVSIFTPLPDISNGFQLHEIVSTASNPVSVAWSSDHLYILGTTTVESHPYWNSWVSMNADGTVGLMLADGSAAQVGVLPNSLIITEKTNVIETVALDLGGPVMGSPALVANIPANVNAPFGLVTRSNNAWVTIAHANEMSLVRDGAVLTTVAPGAQMAPCWVTLDGPFLYSANSPSMSISRMAVYGQKIVLDLEVAAKTVNNPTDIAYSNNVLGVIDSDGTSVTHVSIFTVDEDGNLTLSNSETINSATVNGMAVVVTSSN
ncbi:MAG TPA: hypothetical protein VGL53_15685 [Bryobacteraceae bacterium]|jgi:hypothetical protein